MGLLHTLKRLLGAEPVRPPHRDEDPDLVDARRRIERLDARIETRIDIDTRVKSRRNS